MHTPLQVILIALSFSLLLFALYCALAGAAASKELGRLEQQAATLSILYRTIKQQTTQDARNAIKDAATEIININFPQKNVEDYIKTLETIAPVSKIPVNK